MVLVLRAAVLTSFHPKMHHIIIISRGKLREIGEVNSSA